MEEVILVDADDTEVGTCEKMEAHRRGLRHRALSVIVYDGRGAILLQQRNPAKYHSGGLWANACCSHPRPGESVAAAATRRLVEEMGISCPLHAGPRTHYRADLGGGMTEDEVVHLFFATYSGAVDPAPDEVARYAWVDLEEFRGRAPDDPAYTYWVREYVRRGLI